jgi:hypothetical protein
MIIIVVPEFQNEGLKIKIVDTLNRSDVELLATKVEQGKRENTQHTDGRSVESPCTK